AGRSSTTSRTRRRVGGTSGAARPIRNGPSCSRFFCRTPRPSSSPRRGSSSSQARSASSSRSSASWPARAPVERGRRGAPEPAARRPIAPRPFPPAIRWVGTSNAPTRSKEDAMGADEVSIHIQGATLLGTLSVPAGARGLVVFAHGSGSGRFSPRNRQVAAALEARGLATLLFDLLTAEEERADAIDAHLRFDIPLLAGRLVETIDWAT